MSADVSTPGPPILTPDQRPRVFVSSTLQELAAERAAAKSAIERLRLIPVLFELGARPHAARALYRAYLEQSHVFVAIYFERYGWVAPGEDISGLEDEYRLSGALPRLVYLKSPAPGREPRLNELLDAVRADDSVSYKSFATPDELERLLTEDLAVLMGERFLVGTNEAPRVEERVEAPLGRYAVPAPVSDLVGRLSELAELERLMAGGSRLIALVGPGGIGKSRLALEMARRVGGVHPDRVVYVPLEAVDDPDAVLPAVAASIGLGLDGGAPVLDVLARAFGDREVVLVLDNFEQVLPAAAQLADLLSRCAGMTAVVTSRAPLRIRAETLLPLGPLSLPPDGADVGESDAVRLFAERAAAVRPGFTLDDPEDAAAVAELCRRLDGIPLAIELAAGRSRLLPPRAMLDRLASALDLGTGATDLPARQRTLRDTLAWSEALLEPQQRSLLAALSVFSAPWSLTDAEQVALPGEGDVLDDIAALVENSLIAPVTTAPGEPRFQMYNTVRAYAGEQLDLMGGRVEAEDRFRERMLEAVRDIAVGIRSRDQARWRAEFRLLWPDLRQAWELSLRREDGERAAVAAQVVPALWLDGRSNEVVSLVAESVALATRTRPQLYGEMILMAANSAFYLGDYDQTATYLAMIGTGDVPMPLDPDGVASIPLLQGYVAAEGGRLDVAQQLLRECVASLEGSDRDSARWIEAFAHSGLGSLSLLLGDATDAIDEFETSRRLGAESGNVGAQMQALVFTAGMMLYSGEQEAARTRVLEATELIEQQPYYEGNAYCLEVSAAVALAAGDATGAARALGQARALRELIGARVWPLLEQMSQVVHGGVRDVLGDEGFEAAFAEGRMANASTAAATVRSLLGLRRPSEGVDSTL